MTHFSPELPILHLPGPLTNVLPFHPRLLPHFHQPKVPTPLSTSPMVRALPKGAPSKQRAWAALPLPVLLQLDREEVFPAPQVGTVDIFFFFSTQQHHLASWLEWRTLSVLQFNYTTGWRIFCKTAWEFCHHKLCCFCQKINFKFPKSQPIKTIIQKDSSMWVWHCL